MKTIFKNIILFFGIIIIPVISYSQSIVADHTIVDRYKDIPDEYIVKVKKMLLNIAGESHSRAYRYGLTLLAAQDPKFAVKVDMVNEPELPSDKYLRVSGTVRFPNAKWHNFVGEEDVWTTPWAVNNFVSTITYMDKTLHNPISAMGIGWCYDAYNNGFAGTTDPVYGCRWQGRSAYYIRTDASGNPVFSGDNGWLQWGLDEGDSINLGGPRVTLNMYIRAVEAAHAANPNTVVFFTTTPVDWKSSDYSAGNEGIYQGFVKHEYLRNYVNSHPGKYLFDYADILCWSETGVQRTETWNNHTYQKICKDYISPEYSGYEGGCHINQAACLRLGKAMWWMLARIAGWDGEPISTNPPPSAPKNLLGTANSSSSISITWDASTGNVSEYKIFRNNLLAASTQATNFVDTGLQASTIYQYIVKAYNAQGNSSAASNSIIISTLPMLDFTAPSIPNDLKVQTLSASSVSFTWNASTDNIAVAGYKVYGDSTEIAITDSNNFTDNGLNEGTTYHYFVKAFDAAGNESNFSDILTITTLSRDSIAPTIPQNLQGSVLTSSSISLSWDRSTDNVAVVGYLILMDNIQVAFVTDISFTDIGLLPKTQYVYTVQAIDNSNNISESSSALTLVTEETSTIPAPTNLTVTGLSPSKIRINWYALPPIYGVITYNIYRDNIFVANTTYNTYRDINLSSGVAYTYTVRAFNPETGEMSDNSDAISVTTIDEIAPSVPILFGEVVSTVQILLSWTASTDNLAVAGYWVLRDGKKVRAVRDTSFSQSYLTTGTTYQYSVKAVDENGNFSESSNIVELTSGPTLKSTPEMFSNAANNTDLVLEQEAPSLNTDAKYTAYPNPAREKITITSELENPIDVELVDISGKIIVKKHFDQLPGEINLTGLNLSRSVYYLKINNGKYLSISKIIIM